jgi:hypothetical protein
VKYFSAVLTGTPRFVRDKDDRPGSGTAVLPEYQDMKITSDLFDREYVAGA